MRVRVTGAVLCALAAVACIHNAPPRATQAVPALLIGQFEDDYGGRFSITPSEFTQLPRGRFHVIAWNVAQQYFIAQNDSLNRSDPARWTRIDWMPLPDMKPFTWAFCFSAWNAGSRAEAAAAPIADRLAPRTGCNGFPFTRMKPAASN